MLALAHVALPGDSDYYVFLRSVQATEGQMTPAFSPEGDRFKVLVTQGSATTLQFVLTLDLAKYNPMHCPRITVDGKDLVYSPMENLQVLVPLGAGLGPVQKEVHVRISDPSQTSEGGFLGFLHPQRAHEYVFEVTKPPRLNRLVIAEGISVVDDEGQHVPANPPFDMYQDTYTFTLGADTRHATLQVTCPKFEGVSQLRDGSLLPAPDATQVLDFTRRYTLMTAVTCQYDDSRWASGVVQRTYELHIGRHVDPVQAASMVSAELRLIPDFGYCETVDANDPELEAHHRKVSAQFGEVVARSGFVCRSDKSSSMFVSTFSSADGAEPVTKLVNGETGETVRFTNAIPMTVRMTHERQYHRLHVEVGDISIIYPVVMIWPAECSTIECPVGQCPKPADFLAARENLCLTEACQQKDQPHCCVNKATCDTYNAGCPLHHIVRPDAAAVTCDGVSCTLERDQAICCILFTTVTLTTTTLTSTSTYTTTRTTSTVTTGSSTATSMTNSTTTTASTSTEVSTTMIATTMSSTVETTAGTSTGTTTTSTTTSTTMFCTEADTVWLPLDMAGTEPTIETDHLVCQDRCRRTANCAHYSFWRTRRHCHLQDIGAGRQQWGFGFDSGPPTCTPENLVATTTTNPIPPEFRCMQRGLDWFPSMPALTPKYFLVSEQEAIAACQGWCASVYDCAHFMFDLTQSACRLAGADAEPFPGVGSLVTGPPACDDSYEVIPSYILKYTPGEAPSGDLRGQGVLGTTSGPQARAALPTVSAPLLACACLVTAAAAVTAGLRRYLGPRAGSLPVSYVRTGGRATGLQLLSGEDLAASVLE